MLVAIIEVLGAGLTAVILYQVFVSDYVEDVVKNISNRRERTNAKKIKISNADKIARVKLVSDDIKEIEKFITDNASDISDAMVIKLVSRIEELRANQDIMDDALKTKIDTLTSNKTHHA